MSSELDESDVARQLWQAQSLVLSAAPGAGKTTRVPLALIEHPLRKPGQVWVIEPRRLAARLAATYVADKTKSRLGARVGYRVRDDIAEGADTELIYMTEGMFWRTLLRAPSLDAALKNVSCVVLDEFHTRSLALDCALGLLTHLKRKNAAFAPAVLVMSATLDAAPIAALLGNAPVVSVRGRLHPIDIVHRPRLRDQSLANAVVGAVRHILDKEAEARRSNRTLPYAGRDILVFLPGVFQIVQAERALENLAQKESLFVCPLHARLSSQEQDAAIAGSQTRRIVLSTNVAETSLTLPNVGIVVDSGLAFEPEQEPVSGITRLVERDVSQAALTQRAGRAGRMTPGLCVRLFSVVQEKRRPDFTRSEMTRLPLDEVVLWLRKLGIENFLALPLVDPPPALAFARAQTLLMRLGALSADNAVTALGAQLAMLPVSSRLGAMLIAAADEGVIDEACRAASVLADPPKARLAGRDDVGLSDLWPLCQPEALSDAQRSEAKRLVRLLSAERGAQQKNKKPSDKEEALARATLRGFCDRLATRQGEDGVRPGELPLAIAQLGRARLAQSSRVRANRLMVVLAAQPSTTAQAGWLVTLASAVEPDWLVDLDDDRLKESEETTLTASARYERVVRLSYDGVLIYEQRSMLDNEEQKVALLIARAKTLPLESLVARDALEQLCTRLALVAAYLPQVFDDAKLTPLPEDERRKAIRGDGTPPAAYLIWARDVVQTELRKLLEAGAQNGSLPAGDTLLQQLGGMWPAALGQALRNEVPLAVRLSPHSLPIKVEYTADAPPRITALLQHFFGMRAGPVLLRGKLPIVLALCGPNKRPLQMTRDLDNFWREHYPKLRGALMRRYPRHFWPDEPSVALPQVHKPRNV